MLDAIIVGQVIQRVREEKRMSQELVSGLAGIGRTHLSAIERGERKPTLEADVVGEEHYRIAREVQETLQKYSELQDIIAIRPDALNGNGVLYGLGNGEFLFF